MSSHYCKRIIFHNTLSSIFCKSEYVHITLFAWILTFIYYHPLWELLTRSLFLGVFQLANLSENKVFMYRLWQYSHSHTVPTWLPDSPQLGGWCQSGLRRLSRGYTWIGLGKLGYVRKAPQQLLYVILSWSPVLSYFSWDQVRLRFGQVRVNRGQMIIPTSLWLKQSKPWLTLTNANFNQDYALPDSQQIHIDWSRLWPDWSETRADFQYHLTVDNLFSASTWHPREGEDTKHIL